MFALHTDNNNQTTCAQAFRRYILTVTAFRLELSGARVLRARHTPIGETNNILNFDRVVCKHDAYIFIEQKLTHTIHKKLCHFWVRGRKKKTILSERLPKKEEQSRKNNRGRDRDKNVNIIGSHCVRGGVSLSAKWFWKRVCAQLSIHHSTNSPKTYKVSRPFLHNAIEII